MRVLAAAAFALVLLLSAACASDGDSAATSRPTEAPVATQIGTPTARAVAPATPSPQTVATPACSGRLVVYRESPRESEPYLLEYEGGQLKRFESLGAGRFGVALSQDATTIAFYQGY
jgi:hypothetical protein